MAGDSPGPNIAAQPACGRRAARSWAPLAWPTRERQGSTRELSLFPNPSPLPERIGLASAPGGREPAHDAARRGRGCAPDVVSMPALIWVRVRLMLKVSAPVVSMPAMIWMDSSDHSRAKGSGRPAASRTRMRCPAMLGSAAGLLGPLRSRAGRRRRRAGLALRTYGPGSPCTTGEHAAPTARLPRYVAHMEEKNILSDKAVAQVRQHVVTLCEHALSFRPTRRGERAAELPHRACTSAARRPRTASSCTMRAVVRRRCVHACARAPGHRAPHRRQWPRRRQVPNSMIAAACHEEATS